MGDAEGVGVAEGGDAGSLAASRALQMEGGSLPPRKRLLAGLKQNGWLSGSPPPAEESPTAAGDAGGGDAGGVSADVVVRAGAGKYEEGVCTGCSAVESGGLRRIKRGGVALRLCSACTVLYSKSMFCPHCLAMYHDAGSLGDASRWLVCTRCRRSVHPECEQKHSGSSPDAGSYVCLDCVNSARRQREVNGVTGMRSKHREGRAVSSLHGETGPAAYAGDFVSPALKKPRMHRERRPGDHERGDGSRFERHRSGPDAGGGAGVVAKGASLGPPRKASSQAAAEAASPQEAAVAARNTAIAAVKVAAAAKANAAAKAGAAVKAAAAAKVALEAAAHAAKAEAACRAELRRKMGNSEARLGGGHGGLRLEINVHSEPRRERSSKGEMKHERDEAYGGRRSGGTGSVDDEELARQLHRAINSSPRISRSMTPLRRKQSVKPDTPSSGVSNSSAETVRARPRASAPCAAEAAQEPAHTQLEQEQHHLFRHQQTRPRSITHKEFRRSDSRVSRHEVKTAEGNGQEGKPSTPAERPGEEAAALGHMGGQAAEEAASSVKGEAMEGVMFPGVGAHDEASILFDALVEVDGEAMHDAGNSGGGHERRPDYLQEILEAAVLSDAAMFNDASHAEGSDLETARTEAVAAEQAQAHEAVETGGVQVADSAGGPKDDDGEAGDAGAEEIIDIMTVETCEPMIEEATDAMAVEAPESGDATAGVAGLDQAAEAGDAVAAEAGDEQAGVGEDAMAADVPDADGGIAEDGMGGEAPGAEVGVVEDAVAENAVAADAPDAEGEVADAAVAGDASAAEAGVGEDASAVHAPDAEAGLGEDVAAAGTAGAAAGVADDAVGGDAPVAEARVGEDAEAAVAPHGEAGVAENAVGGDAPVAEARISEDAEAAVAPHGEAGVAEDAVGGDAADVEAREESEALSAVATAPGKAEEMGSTGVGDVEMQEAADVVLEQESAGEAEVEERACGGAAEGDASMGRAVAEGDSSIPLEEVKGVVSESEGASGVSASQQSG